MFARDPNRQEESKSSPNDCAKPISGSPNISGINQFHKSHVGTAAVAATKDQMATIVTVSIKKGIGESSRRSVLVVRDFL